MKLASKVLVTILLLAATGCTQSGPGTPAPATPAVRASASAGGAASPVAAASAAPGGAASPVAASPASPGGAASPVAAASASPGAAAAPSVPSGGGASPVASAPVAARLPLHQGAVLAVTVSRSGDLVASGGADGKVCVVRLSDHKTLVTLQHGAPIDDLAFDTRGQNLISVGGGTVRRWSVPDGRALFALQIKSGHVILAPDGSTVASIEEARVGVWDTASGRLLRNGPLRSRRLKRKVVTGAFSADGTYLVLGGSEQADEGGPEYAQTWTISLSVGGREDAPVFGNDGTRLDGIAVTYDNKTWVMVTQGTSPVWHVYAHVDGAPQATELEAPANGPLRHVVLGAAGKRVVLLDDTARLFDVPLPPAPTPSDDSSDAPDLPSTPPALHPSPRFDFGPNVQDAAFTPDRTTLVTGGSDGAVTFYAIGTP